MQAHELHVVHRQRTVNDHVHVLHADTELVFGQTGGDVGVCMCAYIRIDTESYTGNLVLGGGQFIDDLQLGNRFNIEAEDIVVQSQVNLPVCLSDSGIYNLAGRNTCLDGRLDFAAAHTIGAQSAFTDDAQNFRVGIGLHCIVYAELVVLATLFLDCLQGLSEQVRIVIIKRCFQFTEFIQREDTFHKFT